MAPVLLAKCTKVRKDIGHGNQRQPGWPEHRTVPCPYCLVPLRCTRLVIAVHGACCLVTDLSHEEHLYDTFWNVRFVAKCQNVRFGLRFVQLFHVSALRQGRLSPTPTNLNCKIQ